MGGVIALGVFETPIYGSAYASRGGAVIRFIICCHNTVQGTHGLIAIFLLVLGVPRCANVFCDVKIRLHLQWRAFCSLYLSHARVGVCRTVK